MKRVQKRSGYQDASEEGDEYPKSAAGHTRDNGCELTIHIYNQGGVINIYNCPPSVEKPCAEIPPEYPATGACIPLPPGSKPKKTLRTKLRPLLANNRVPSALAASFFHSARRFGLGRSPANELEATTFGIFQRLSPELRRVLACSVQVFDALPARDRDRLFSPEISGLGDRPLNVTRLAELVADEIIKRASLEVFDSEECATEERPGLARFFDLGLDDVGDRSHIGICTVNGLRTNAHVPRLSLSDYTPEERQQQCTLEVVDDKPQLNCKPQTENCPGNQVEGGCLRVPEVAQGQVVFLSGFNFFNIDARVLLEAKPPGTVTREVEAHVCGDINTPMTENVNGVERVIHDCRVKDFLSFQVPQDLPEGIYGITVLFANNSGDPNFGQELRSAPRQYIQVLPTVSATFQIATEQLEAVDVTNWEWGSDEVAIQIIAVPIGLDLTPGEINEDNTFKFRFGDVDSGEEREMNRLIFQQSNFGWVALSIIGHEVDSEEAYEKQIEDFTDAYIEVLGSQWNAIATALGAAGGIVAGALGASYAWSLAIAALITFAVDVFVAVWAPADLIIEDAATFSALDLATRLSPNYPPPPVIEFTSPQGIDVKVEPISKDAQYLELRKYDSGGSEYHIRLRYNRLQSGM